MTVTVDVELRKFQTLFALTTSAGPKNCPGIARSRTPRFSRGSSLRFADCGNQDRGPSVRYCSFELLARNFLFAAQHFAKVVTKTTKEDAGSLLPHSLGSEVWAPKRKAVSSNNTSVTKEV